MKTVFILAGTVGMVVLTLALAGLVLPACGIVLPFGLGAWRYCPESNLADADEFPERAALLSQITESERNLTALSCTAEPATFDPPAVIPSPNAPIDPEVLKRGDLAALQGCWSLGSEYAAVDPDSGTQVDFSDWKVCFGPDGVGDEEMRGSDGATCKGPVTVSFDEGQALVISEPGDLPCSNGFTLYRREVRCTVDATGTADCRSLQPEVSGDAPVIMRRAQEQP